MAALRPAHHATARTSEVTPEVFHDLIEAPLATIERWRPDLAEHLEPLDAVKRGESTCIRQEHRLVDGRV